MNSGKKRLLSLLLAAVMLLSLCPVTALAEEGEELTAAEEVTEEPTATEEPTETEPPKTEEPTEEVPPETEEPTEEVPPETGESTEEEEPTEEVPPETEDEGEPEAVTEEQPSEPEPVQKCGENVYWTLDEDGVLTISGTGAMYDYEYEARPGWYNSLDRITVLELGEGITHIGDKAFESCYCLTSVTIPDSVTSIGRSVFGVCSALTNVELNNGLESIGDMAFCNCFELTAIRFPASLQSIGNWAFEGCTKLKGVSYGGTLAEWASVELGNNSFEFVTCTNGKICPRGQCGENVFWTLDENGVLAISGSGAMYDYEYEAPPGWYNSFDRITVLELGEGITHIGDGAFDSCSSLTSVAIPESVTSIGDFAFSWCDGLTSITIPEGVMSIGEAAFEGCGLTSITIPDSVTSIGNYAFYVCSSLTSITIPAGVTSIGDWAFCVCSNLTSICVAEDNQKYSSIEGVLFNKDWTTLICCPNGKSGDYVIPQGVTNIGDSAFSCCSNLTSITIPEGVTSIGDGVFFYCSNLTSITIPEGVTSIGEEAFEGCGLTSIAIPASVTSIGDYAFYDCSSLTNVYYGGTEEQWKAVSKGYCAIPAGATVHFAEAPEPARKCGDNVYWTLDEDGVLTISGTGKMWDYGETDADWEDAPWYGLDVKSVVIEAGVTSIGNYAFFWCDGLTSITIPDGLTSITIPDSVTSIGDSAFSYCSSLTSITIPEGVTSIGDYAFWDCSSLTSITIPEGVTSIGYHAFYLCNSLTSICVAADNQKYSSIDGVLFNKDQTTVICCPGGKSGDYVIPKGVKTIGDSAFDSCSSLTSITIPEGVTSIGERAFCGCENLTSIAIPEGVTSIGDYAFAGCSSLTSIAIPEGVTSIGYHAFYGCYGLTSITIPESVKTIGVWAFGCCSSLTDVYYGGTEEQWNAIEKDDAEIPETATVHFTEKPEPIPEGQHLAPISAPTGDVPLADFSVEVNYGGVTNDADKAKAQRQIAETVNDNQAVRNFTDSDLRTAIAGQENTLLTALQVEGLTADDLILGVSMEPTAATVVEGKVTKMSFEIKPTVTVFVEGMEAPVSTEVPNSVLSAPVTVRLPIDKATPVGTIVKVEHNGNYFGSFAVREENGDKFIEFATTEFSVYSYELTEDNIGVINDVVYSATLTLRENINVNFYVKVPVNAANIDVTQFVVTSVFDGKTKTARLSEKNYVDKDKDYKRYKVVVSESFAYQMNDTVTLSVSYAGVPVQKVQNYPYSVRKYFENNITKFEGSAKAADKSFVALCKAGLDYGANAQMHFSGGVYDGGRYPVYTGDAIVNSTVNPENDLSRAVKPTAVTKKEGDIAGFSGYSASLVLGSLTSIKLYFMADSIDGVTVTANCGGDPYGVTTPLLGTDGRYSFLVQGIKSYDLAKPFTIRITKGDSTVTITYSVFSYAAKNWEVSKDNMGDLCKALVLYGICADDYFTNYQ